MQAAAALLSVIAPVNQGKSAAGGVFGQGDAVEGAAVDPFAQALAALMAAQPAGQIQAQANNPKAGEDAAPVESGDKGRGIETALAATAQTNAAANGLNALIEAPVEDLTLTPDAPETVVAAALPQEAGAEQAPATSAPSTETAPGDAATAPVLPQQAKADEALAARLASPPPRADRANDVAAGPRQAPWAEPAPTAAPDAPVAEAAPAPPETSPTAETAAQAAPTAAPVLASAEALASAQAPRAEGKALGRSKIDGAPQSSEVRGREFAPGQVKTAEADAEADLAPSDAAAAAHEAPSAEASLDDAAPPPVAPTEDMSIETAASDAPAEPTLAASAETARPFAAALSEVRAAAHTVTHLASQLIAKASDGTTRFDVQLDPLGLGAVDVKIEINRAGEMSAALSFDNPQTAAELRGRAGELQKALEQAGFDLSRGGLSFEFNGQRDGREFGQQQAEAQRPAWRAAAFTDLAAIADAPPPQFRRGSTRGVDVTI